MAKIEQNPNPKPTKIAQTTVIAQNGQKKPKATKIAKKRKNSPKNNHSQKYPKIAKTVQIG